MPFLLRILEHPRFRAGEVDTGFLDGEGASLATVSTDDAAMPDVVREAIASYESSVSSHQSSVERRAASPESRVDPWDQFKSWRL